MNTAAIYHRPESEFAYLYTNEIMHIRLRTARADCQKVALLHGDPYQLDKQWFNQPTPMKKILTTDLYDYWEIEVRASFSRLSYAFLVEGYDGTAIFFTEHGVFPVEEKYVTMANNYFRMPYFHEIDRFKAPQWIKETVWYQIFPERFANGNTANDPEGTLAWGSKEHPDRQDFYGGDLQGVLDNLDYLSDLGINGLYFCPIFKAHSNHKYDTSDYFEIDPAFGDKELFKKLVTECHHRGIKVMLDAVFNHIGDTSPQWQDVIKNGEQSAFKEWFHIHSFPVTYTATEDFEVAEELNFDTFAFTPHMPKLNTANPEVQEYILSIARYWIEEFDIDAWRLDVANEVDHHLWKKFHETCHAVKKDFYILGEVWHSSQSWLQGDEFSAVMNYAFTDSITHYFLEKKISLEKMVSNLNEQLALYRRQTNQLMLNTIDSHDTPRILTLANDNKDLMKQVLAFLYLQQGIPCLYYGDEVGMNGGMDPDCRKCMEWDPQKQDLDMHQFVKSLIALRHENQKIVSDGSLDWQTVDASSGTLIFSRKLDSEQLIGLFNTGEESISVHYDGEYTLSHLAVSTEGEINIEPNGFMILKK
ncbi:MAG: glycoside hydrolase family 13 protein [Enterococcus sp.]